jgi:hypothetical protein
VQIVVELTLLFMLGSLAYAWRDALPLSLVAALAAIGLIAWNPGGHMLRHRVGQFLRLGTGGTRDLHHDRHAAVVVDVRA